MSFLATVKQILKIKLIHRFLYKNLILEKNYLEAKIEEDIDKKINEESKI